MSEASPSYFVDSFKIYFSKPVAELAAKSLTDGTRIEFCITNTAALDESSVQEIFYLEKKGGQNHVEPGIAFEPDLTFRLSPQAAEQILNHESDDIGEIGVFIAKLILSHDPAVKVSIKLNVGFLKLFTKGYLGVVAAGGKSFAQFLASKGLGGMSALKAVISKLAKK